MQKFAGTCSPEQLHTLQTIFDLIWMELMERTHSEAQAQPWDTPVAPVHR